MSFWKIIGGEDDNEKKRGQTETSAASDVPGAETKALVDSIPTVASANQPALSPASKEKDAERYGKVRSALGPGTVIQGKLSFDTTVSIDGKLSGEVVSSKAIIVGPGGDVDAVMNVASLVVRGRVKGKIVAMDSVELLAGAQLDGELQTPSLIVEEGAVLRATCSMSNGKIKAIR